jgi:hypothetical protein
MGARRPGAPDAGRMRPCSAGWLPGAGHRARGAGPAATQSSCQPPRRPAGLARRPGFVLLAAAGSGSLLWQQWNRQLPLPAYMCVCVLQDLNHIKTTWLPPLSPPPSRRPPPPLPPLRVRRRPRCCCLLLLHLCTCSNWRLIGVTAARSWQRGQPTAAELAWGDAAAGRAAQLWQQYQRRNHASTAMAGSGGPAGSSIIIDWEELGQQQQGARRLGFSTQRSAHCLAAAQMTASSTSGGRQLEERNLDPGWNTTAAAHLKFHPQPSLTSPRPCWPASL